jgi:hypothetical protein
VATGTFRVSVSSSHPSCTKRGTFSVRFTRKRHLAIGTCTPPHTMTLAEDDASRVYQERYVYDPVIGRGILTVPDALSAATLT